MTLPRTLRQQTWIDVVGGYGRQLGNQELIDVADEIADDYPLPPVSATWLTPVAGLYVSGYAFSPNHLAVDFASHSDRIIKCPSNGTITFSGEDKRPELAAHPEWNRGWYVEIDHDDGYKSRWCHMVAQSPAAVGRVLKGADIGIMGMTGYATGVHCHCSVLDPAGVAIDPMTMWG